MNDEIEKNRLVVKSNKLITARYKLTLMEQKLIVLLISLINKDDEDFKLYTLKIQDIANFLELKGQSLYSSIKDLTAKILSRVLQIENDKDGTLTQMHWLSRAKYFKKMGCVELTFDPDLKEYLLQLKEKFTRYQLQGVKKFNSIYSIRIYELLKQFEAIGVRTFTIKELREIFSLNPDEYKFYGDFKRKIIVKAKVELESNECDIYFDIVEVKKGKRVEALTFTIYKRVPQKKLPFPEVQPIERDMLIESLKKYKFSKSQILEIMSYPYGQIASNIQYTEKYEKTAQIENFTGFLYIAIKKNFASKKLNSQENQKKCPKCGSPLILVDGEKKIDDFLTCEKCKKIFYKQVFPSLYL